MSNNSIPQQQKRAILYARVSGDDRKNATSSIEAQLSDCRRYADQRDYLVVGEYFEEPNISTSGADWLPELDKILRLAPSHTFEVVICREVDRLARNRFKQMATEIELKNHGVAVEYAIGQYSDTPEGNLLKGLVSEFAEYERDKIRRRTYSGMVKSVEAGNVSLGGGDAPYGYDIAVVNGKRTLVINEAEAAIVRLIFELYGQRMMSLHEVAKYLDERAVPLPAKSTAARRRSLGMVWSPSSLQKMMEQEAYLGRWYFRKTKKIKDPMTGKAKQARRGREEWIEVPVPAIISEAAFVAVTERRIANKVQKGRQRKYTYTLGGMLKCGECGFNMFGMTVKSDKTEYGYYRCNTRVHRIYGERCRNKNFNSAEVEEKVWAWVESVISDPTTLQETIDEHVRAERERLQPQLSMRDSARNLLTEKREERQRLIEAYAKGVFTLDDIAPQKTAIDKEIDDLSRADAALSDDLATQQKASKFIDSNQELMDMLRKGIEKARGNKAAQRELYQLIDMEVKLSSEGDDQIVEINCVLGKKKFLVASTMTGLQCWQKWDQFEIPY